MYFSNATLQELVREAEETQNELALRMYEKKLRTTFQVMTKLLSLEAKHSGQKFLNGQLMLQTTH